MSDRECLCGECGRTVARRYQPGHDRRHTARLVREVLDGSLTIERALAEIGPYPLAERFEGELAAARRP